MTDTQFSGEARRVEAQDCTDIPGGEDIPVSALSLGKGTEPVIDTPPSGAPVAPVAVAPVVAPIAPVAAPVTPVASVASAEQPTDANPKPLSPSYALTLADFTPPSSSPIERLVRLAYRLGVPGSQLAAPFRKPAMPRILATVESPLVGNRAAGLALRAGYLLVHGSKTAIDEIAFSASAHLTLPFVQTVHGFGWLRDLAASGPRETCADTAERICRLWLGANRIPHKGEAWSVEQAGHRVLAMLVHAPLILSNPDKQWRHTILSAIERGARWLDRNVMRENDRLAKTVGWAAITAAGLLLPDGKPRRIYGEAGLLSALGELVASDGGVRSRSPLAQIAAIELLIDLRACYEAVEQDMPAGLDAMLALLVPPLLALRHSDGGLGSWHGAPAINAQRITALIEASRVRTRPLADIRDWGFQRLTGGKSVVQFDAAPPPRARFARSGCASTLAFEMSDGPHRLVVNCGGAASAGGLVPKRIERGLRASAAHSTLVLEDANSTAVLIKGKLGKGVETVDVDRQLIKQGSKEAMRIEASHDGYAARFGLAHRRILMLRADGNELRGEDILVPSTKRPKRGKIGFAIRFHLGRHVEAGLSEDRCGASLALPDGNMWQFRLAGGTNEAKVSLEESMWIDGDGKPCRTQQLIIEGMTPRGGEQFSWLLKKMH